MISLAAALLIAAGPVLPVPPRSVALVICAPGYPGTTAEAQPSVDALVAALSHAGGLPDGALSATYLNAEEEGVAQLKSTEAAVAMVPVPFYVKYAVALSLHARLAVVRQGAQGPLETWALVAGRGRITSPAALAGFTVVSIAGYSPAFVRGALASWGRLPPDAHITFSNQVLSALRRAAAGEAVAVLLDGEQTAALPTLPFAGQLEVVARSAPLPGAFVATVGDRLEPARWRALEKALLALPSTAEGSAALEGVRMQGFAPLPPDALSLTRRMGAP
ncbi:MAG TPA: PhnD/SsuA/transferrin family substrate-binding protein [Anaeromyxobacter sp.]|nr:PhnD/SsuA/transferrin family substrate-binding protein [Anaeromyxobacter sp.]